jgi:hypothetical protein
MGAHEALHALVVHLPAPAAQLGGDPRRSLDPVRVGIDGADLGYHLLGGQLGSSRSLGTADTQA